MKKLRAFGLTALVLLLPVAGASALEQTSGPTDQDYADCGQSNDTALSILACTRVIDSGSAAAADRAAAYLYRGNAHMARSQVRDAIGDYGWAIEFDRRNITAYAARALAHLSNGDQRAAVSDYRAATKIDPKQIDQMAASNPDLAELAAIARSQPITQRAVLLEEDPKNPAGRRYEGAVTWRTESASARAGQSSEPAARAEIEIPDRQVEITLSVRRNTDAALPASHTIQIEFKLPADRPDGGVSKVVGITAKGSESEQGTLVAGATAKINANTFLIAISNLDNDLPRNGVLLHDRWLDIPIVYDNGRRAIVSLEKGLPVDRILATLQK